jgi:hypothetical protein
MLAGELFHAASLNVERILRLVRIDFGQALIARSGIERLRATGGWWSITLEGAVEPLVQFLSILWQM